MAKPTKRQSDTPTVLNRKARHNYLIEETFEVGVALVGSEVKSIRDGQVSIAEGFVRVEEDPPGLFLHGVHIMQYAPAAGRQHPPARVRRLLAHKREIRKLAALVKQKGVTIVPLKLYFSHGWAKVEIGVARGKRQSDKRQALKTREARRDIDRAMSKKVR